ncbi:hypothetical protein A2U01_0104815, partial [Trifolium medium]|nr:hypothetical protein [Trifolium medium]
MLPYSTMSTTTSLQSSSIDTLDSPMSPSQLMASLRPIASASVGE